MVEESRSELKDENSPAVTQLPEALQRALVLHESGQLAQAQAIYEEILRIAPGHYDATNLLGTIAVQTGNHQRAAHLFGKAIELDPTNVVAYCNYALALTQLQQFDAALANYDRAIEINGELAEAHFKRANVLRELKRFDAALAGYRRAIELEPDYAEGYLFCGDMLRELKQFDAALASYDRAISIIPDYEQAYFHRGNVLAMQKRFDAAVVSYNRAIALKPHYPEAYSNRGYMLAQLKRYDEALADYDQAISLQSNYAEAYSNRGIVLAQLKRFDEALADYDQAIVLNTNYPEAYSNRGIVLRELQQWEKALASYDQAIALKPDYAEAHSNRGNVLAELQLFDAALNSYDQAIALNADYAAAYTARSFLLLSRGDLGRGWVDYEWRLRIKAGAQNHTQPRWLGNESLAGKTILLHGEQGLGDTLQFCRYVKLVADLGAKVVLQVHRPLVSLLESLDGVSQIVAVDDPLPEFEYHCSLLSLPLAFKTSLASIPFSATYLAADETKMAYWQSRLGDKSKPRVGLVWRGNPKHGKDYHRSAKLADLIQHLPAGLQYISLQKEVNDSERQALQSSGMLQFADDLNDFSDTAALCACMDLLISVDTSVAHLAGALGVNTWIMLASVPDWRWLLDRQDSPWYPAVRLYRRGSGDGWNGVLTRIRLDLHQTFQLQSN